MQEQLKQILQKSEQLAAQLSAPETYADPELSSRLLREQKSIQPLTDACRRYMTLQEDYNAAKELGLSSAETAEIREEIIAAEQVLKKLLIPRDSNDERNVIMEIRAGTGGEEAALFAADLFRMYSAYAAKQNWKVEVISSNATELGGFREIIFTISGNSAWSRLKYEAGSHCVKRIPETESSGRIQTSTATVAVLPELSEVDFHLDMKDVRIDVFRASGAGGQKVNKTSSAVRVIHLPTNTVVECQDERSQLQNKERALQILRGRLWEEAQRRQNDAVGKARRGMVGSGERSERIRTYFFLRGQIVDQRLSGDTRVFQLESVLNGNLDELIDRLTTEDQMERLKSQNDED